MVSIPCRALPRQWEEANAKNWAVGGHCPRWLWLPEGMNKPESIGEGQHFHTVCLQPFGTNAKQKDGQAQSHFLHVLLYSWYTEVAPCHMLAYTHRQSIVASTKQPLTKKQLSYMKHLICGDEVNTRASVKGYVCAHTLCTALQKSTSTVNCSGQLSSLKQMMFLKHTVEK